MNAMKCKCANHLIAGTAISLVLANATNAQSTSDAASSGPVAGSASTSAAAPVAIPAPMAAPASTPAAATPGLLQLPPPPPGKGLVVFFRKPLFSLVPFNWIAREGKTEICEMEASTYCLAVVDPGTHTYEVHSEVKNDVTLEVDAGETYYLVGGISMGLIVNHPNIAPVQQAAFDAISAKLKPIPAITGALAQ